VGPQPCPDAGNGGVSFRRRAMKDGGRRDVDLIATYIGCRGEPRVDEGHVVALEIILDIGLPVAANRVRRAMRDGKAVPFHALNLGRERRDDTCERFGVKVHIDEYETAPPFAPQGEEREFARIEICSRTKIARQGEAAIERVAPAMVATGESRPASA